MLRSAVVQGCVLGVLLTSLSFAPSTATAAERPPQLNIKPSCDVAAGVVSGRTRESCINDENTARRTLDDTWKDFSAKQHARCTALVHMGGPPSYVELLTCLEMAQQAKQIPDRGLMSGKGGMGTFAD